MSDALDGQAALDEANNEITRLRAKLAESERVIDFQREEMRAAHERKMSEDGKAAEIHRLTAEVERLREELSACRAERQAAIFQMEYYDKALTTCAAGPWRTDDPPRDGTIILACFDTPLYPWIVRWDAEQDYEDQSLIGWGWACARNGDLLTENDPVRWAEIRVETSDE